MITQNVLKITNDTLHLEGFDKIKEKMILSFLSNSIVIYPYQNEPIKHGQIICEISSDRTIIDSVLTDQIRHHFGRESKSDMELSFMDSPIYELRRDSYIYLPSKQKTPL